MACCRQHNGSNISHRYQRNQRQSSKADMGHHAESTANTNRYQYCFLISIPGCRHDKIRQFQTKGKSIRYFACNSDFCNKARGNCFAAAHEQQRSNDTPDLSEQIIDQTQRQPRYRKPEAQLTPLRTADLILNPNAGSEMPLSWIVVISWLFLSFVFRQNVFYVLNLLILQFSEGSALPWSAAAGLPASEQKYF